MDGSKGEIYDQKMDITSSDLPEEFLEILEYANDIKKLSVRANAETFEDVKAALEFGANGIGLCRTEHMFFDPEKIILFQCMILESSIEKRESILKNLQKFHKEDFLNIFKLLKDKPFNIRLLDPPIHEFLPKTDLEIQKISKILNISKEIAKEKISTYTESNPMLGHRGCRLGITHEDIYRMQIRAIFEAAYDFFETSQITPNIEIMIPLISTEEELIILRNMIKDEEFIISKKRKYELKYKIGTMIELPRSIVISDELAKHVDFFSYGTNDLTQTIFGISRDDVSSFMHEYRSKSIFKFDPVVRIDEKAVGSLIESSVIKGRKTNKNISIGVCGEHGGDPESIRFFDRINVDYISCSPYRIYKARIAAAQAHIKNSI